MGQYILFGVGLLISVAIYAADGACPELRPMKKLLCYLELKGTPPPLDTCLCTHLVVTTPINKLTPDSEVLSNIKEMRARNPDLQVLGMATDPAENVIKRRGAYVKNIVNILRKSGLDGIELDFKWTNKYNGKETFLDLVKLLSQEMNKLGDDLRRSKRNSEEDEEKEEEEGKDSEEIGTEKSETDSSSIEDASTETTTKAPTKEEKKEENKDSEKEEVDISDETSEKHPIIVRLPIQPKALAKNFDLKRLSKYVNFFTISSENVTDSSETGLTYHPSRLMGIEDILNTDSLVDLITGLGAPHPKLIISLPGFALRFTLSDQEKNLPLSPIKNTPQRISQAELCTQMSEGKWTIERDEDLTAPYAFKNDTWLAFDDPISTAIKGKYILLRDLAGAAIVTLDYEDWLGKCNKTSLTLLPTLYDTFTNMARKSRAAQLISLQEQLHQSSPYAFSADVQLSPYRIVRVVDRAGDIHVVRKEAKTEFECSRQGYFRHPSGCNRFYRCVKFNQYTPDYTVFEYDCPAGLAFDEKYEVCVWPGSLEDGGACQGSSEIAPVPRNRYTCPRVEGYYADPENCRWFFACLDHVRDGVSPLTAYEFRCPFGLVFNEQTLTCDWPWNVAGCGAAGSYRAHLTVGDIIEGRTRASYATLPDYHVSGGRIENAGGGVVLGSLLPGVVDGISHQGAYSNEFGSKFYGGGSGLYHGAGLHAGGYGQSSGAYAGHGLESGQYHGGLTGIYSGASGKYSGSSAGHESGQYHGGIYSGADGKYTGHGLESGQYHGGIYSGADGKYSGSSAGHGLESGQYHGGVYSGADGKYSGSSAGHGLESGQYQGGVYSGADGQYHGGVYSGAAGKYSGGTGSYSGIYGGQYAAGQYAGGNVHPGIGGVYNSGSGKYSGSGEYSGSSGKYEGGKYAGTYSGENGQYSGSSIYSAAGKELGGSSGVYGGSAGHEGAYVDSGYEFNGQNLYSGGETGHSGSAAGGLKYTTLGSGYTSGSGLGIGSTGAGLTYSTGIKSGAGIHSGAYGSHDGVHLAGVGVGDSYEGSKHVEGLQTHSGVGGTIVQSKPTTFGSFESNYAVKGHYGGESLLPGQISSHDGGYDLGYEHGAAGFHASHGGEIGAHGFVSSTPAPPVTQFYASTPVVSTYKTPIAVTPTPISISTYKPSLSTPRPSTYYLPADSHISVPSPTPFTFPKPVVYESATIKPVQHFSPVPVTASPIPIVHEAVPVGPLSPSPSPLPTVVKDYHGYSSFGYKKVSPPLSVTPIPPLSPVSYLSGVSYHKSAVPVSTISPPAVVPVSTPAPPVSSVKLSYHPRPYPVPIESYHVTSPVTLPAVPVSTPAPPVHFETYSPKPVVPVSISTPAPQINYYPKPQPVVPIHSEEYEGYHYSKSVTPVSSTISPPLVVPVSTPAPPVKYYPKPQPVVPIHSEGYESYHYSKPVIPVSTVSPPVVVPVSTPAPPVQYYRKPQPVVPIHTEGFESYQYSKPVVSVSSTVSPPAPYPSPVSFSYSTPASISYHSEEGYQYSKPVIGYSYPKPSAEVFKSVVSLPVPTVTPAPIIVSSTPSYSFKSEYVKPVEFKSSTIAVTATPVPLLPVQYKNVEVGYTYPKVPLAKAPINYGFSYPPSFEHHVDAEHTYKEISSHVPLITPSALPPPSPTPIQPVFHSVQHPYPKPTAVPVVPLAPAPYKPDYELRYEKPLLPKLSSPQVVHKYEEFSGYGYQKPIISEYKPALPQPIPSALPPLNYGYYPKPVVYKSPVTPAPKDYYHIPTAAPPISPIHYGVVYEKNVAPPSPQPTIVASPSPSPAVVHYESVTTLPPVSYKVPALSYGSAEFSKGSQVYFSSPKPFAVQEPEYNIKYSTTPAPPVKPINYGYSYPKPAPSIIPAIQVSSTPVPPLNPVTYTYKQPQVNFYSTTAGNSVYSTPSPPAVPSYQPISTVTPVPVTPPPIKVDYIQPPVQYLPPVRKVTPSYVKPLPPVSYSTPSPFKPSGFAQLGPKYQLVDVHESAGFVSSTPLPPPAQPAEISSYKFGYAYEKPASIEVSSITPSPLPTYGYKSTVKPAVYVPPVVVTSTPAPPPAEPMYQQVFNVLKTPVVSAYEKVLNVLKTSTPAAPVYVNHYTTPAPEPVIPVSSVSPVPVIPHRFEFGSVYEKEHGDSLYESLKNEFGTKLTTVEGYDYPKPVVPFQEEIPLPNLRIPSTTYRPVVTKTHTTQKPAYVDTYDEQGSYDYNAGKDEIYYSSTPAPPTYVTQSYKPVIKQYLQEVYSKPAINVAYGAEEGYVSGVDKVQFVTSTTPAPLPPVTTARVSLPIVKTGGCVNCGYSNSQKVKINPPPVTFSTTSTPFTTISSTGGYSYTSPTFSTTPIFSSTTPAYSADLDEEHELEVANEEEEEGAKILAGYHNSGQFGGVISSSAGLKGIALTGGSVSSTTVSSLKDGEAIVGVVKKEKNIYTGRRDKTKVVVVSRLSDFNPILVGKLGAECSCKSNPVNLQHQGDISNHRVDSSSGLFIPNGPDLVSNPPIYTSSSLSPIIVPDSIDYQNSGLFSAGYGEKNSEQSQSSFVEIKPVPYRIPTTISPVTKVTQFYETVSSPEDSSPVYTVSPTTVSSTVVYEEPTKILHGKKVVNTLVHHKPAYVEKSLRPTYQQVLVPTIPAQTIADLDAETKVTAGKSFDRYGPGGWRGLDETLQGSVDCKRPGLFRHPKYCNKFYSCNWDQWKKRYTLHVFNCPIHLAYDSQLGACNWPSKGPACVDDNLLV